MEKQKTILHYNLLSLKYGNKLNYHADSNKYLSNPPLSFALFSAKHGSRDEPMPVIGLVNSFLNPMWIVELKKKVNWGGWNTQNN